MASYFPNSESERPASRMLQDPSLATYSDAAVFPSNLMPYMDYSSSSGSLSTALAGHAQQQLGDHDLNEWKNGRNSMILMTHVGDAASVLQGSQNMQGQGLSLSLSTNCPPDFPMSSLQCHSPNTYKNGYFEYVSPDFPRSSSDIVRTDVSPSGMASTRAVSSSKYLKVAQQLLNEVVNVKKALREKHSRNGMANDPKETDGGSKNGDSSDHPGSGSSLNPQESNDNSPSQLSASEKQDLHNKISKLLAMSDEVDKRYKQYYHQMQIVVSSFEVIAGSGAARPYTALALQTISRHFRCLRDAISDQVQETRKSLGGQDASGNSKGVGISRLRYVDQQIKQQRTLHQLGLMQQQAWRPQRGLPESSVTVLRAWLFEHFLHPYPKDSDKIMLARQAGLTRSQVSNWFINARVRLWKPMVEEMYKEEAADAEMDSTSHSNPAEKTTNSDIRASEDTGEDLVQSTVSTATEFHSRRELFESSSDHAAGVEVEPYSSQSIQASSHAESERFQRPAVNNYGAFPDGAIIQSSEGRGGFMAAAAAPYQMSELERFENGSGVSLTLGLQHCDGSSVPMCIEAPPGYMPMRGDGMYNETASSMVAQPSEFDYMDSGNRHHRLGSSSQLLHDFVV